MEFKNIFEVQALLNKTTSTVDRLQTSLFLMNCKFSELNNLLPLLKDCVTILQVDSVKGKNS